MAARAAAQIALRPQYFLDWRPVGAPPLKTIKVRHKRLDPDDVRPYVEISRNHVPGFDDVFFGADILGRADGVFVVRIEFKSTARFNTKHLEELAWAVCMAAKTKLGHKHDVHGQKSLAKEGERLDPSEILITFPVQVEPDFWEPIFAKRDFDNADLQKALCVPRAALGPGEKPRNALICLRRAYFKVFENVQSHLEQNRKEQIESETLDIIFANLPRAFIFFVVLYGALTIPSGRFGEPTMAITFVFAALVLLPFFAFFTYELDHLFKWDLWRIKLLRSAETFFSYANPLNGVISQILQPSQTGQQVQPIPSDFNAISGVVKSKAAGEVHRANIRQQWLTLTMAGSAIFFAALAVQSSVRGVTEAIASPLGLKSLNCSAHTRDIGPFLSGANDTLGLRPDAIVMAEVIARNDGVITPAEIVEELLAGGANADDIVVLVGSTDEVSVRPLSPIESNNQLAEMRAVWARDTIRRMLEREPGPDPSVVTLNETMHLARVVLEPETSISGRVVAVCVGRRQ